MLICYQYNPEVSFNARTWRKKKNQSALMFKVTKVQII